MMSKTKKAYEAHLNELYADMYSEGQALDQFCYLNGGKIKNSTIAEAYTAHTLGSLLRRHDPVAFNVGFNDWNRK